MSDFIHVIPEIFLLISSLLLLPMVNTKKAIITFIVMVISLILACWPSYYNSNLIFHDLIAISPFVQHLKIIILALVAITLLMISSVDLSRYSKELPIIIIFSTIGMLSLVASHDLLSMYMAIELQSLPMYIMAAINRKSLYSAEAGIKYFILGALASGILLYGISMVYGFTGSTNFVDLTKIFREDHMALGVLIGSILIISALSFKIAAVPFHMWAPDVYQGSPTVITTFFAVVPKVALVGLLIRLFDYELTNVKLQQVFILIGMLSMIVSAISALRQTNIKRLLAYSSIGHMGYILVGIAAAITSKSGVTAIILYITLYALMNIGIFAFILYTARYKIKDLTGFSKQHPFVALLVVLLLLSMAGIPPTAGFFAKLYILSQVIDIGLWWLALFALFTSVISAFYYLRIIKIMYFDIPTVQESITIIKNSTLLIIIAAAAGLNTIFFLYADCYLNYLSNIVKYL